MNEISVIIPTMNEEKYIGRLLKSIKDAGFNGEIIVVDGGSKDRTMKIARKYGAKVYVKKGNVAFARNYGARKAHGDIFVFLDADMVVGRNFFREVRKKIHKFRTLVFNPLGNDMNGKASYLAFLFNKIMAQFIKFGLKYMTGGGVVVTRKYFEMAGGFNERMIVAEDMEFLLKAGGKLGMVKENRFSYRRYVKYRDIAVFVYSFLTMSDHYWRIRSY